MELQFESKPIRCLEQCIWDTQEVEQTQEVRLSDDMPDIGSILCAWGQCVLRGKEWRSDSIGVSGGIMAWVLYLPADGGEPRTVEAWLPMQCKWNKPESKQEGVIRTSWLLHSVDGRMLSARKMMVRANAQVLAEAVLPSEREVFQPLPVPEDVQLLKKTFDVSLPTEAGEKAFPIDEEIVISGFEQLIGNQIQPVVNEQSVVGGKAVFRGEARVHLVYRGMDGMIHSVDRECDFSQFADLDKDYDKEATVCVMPAISNVETEQTDSGVRVKAAMVMQYLVYDRQLLETVVDAYSPVRQVGCRMNELNLPLDSERWKEKQEYSVTFPVNPSQVADVTVWPMQSTVRYGEAASSGNLQMLYYDESGELAVCMMPYDMVLDAPVGENRRIRAMVQSYQQPQMHGANAQGSVVTALASAQEGNQNVVTGLELGDLQRPDANRPSLILRRAGEESLWEMAKNSGATVDAIMAANGLEGEPEKGRMLMIPVS